jgi:hydrophobic/amphiphilic exporter-1 (mainly G- bacteria), HAE1 family
MLLIGSTCLAVLFVPTFLVVVQRFENWLAERKGKRAGVQTAGDTPGST